MMCFFFIMTLSSVCERPNLAHSGMKQCSIFEQDTDSLNTKGLCLILNYESWCVAYTWGKAKTMKGKGFASRFNTKLKVRHTSKYGFWSPFSLLFTSCKHFY